MNALSFDKINRISQQQWLLVAGAAAAGLFLMKSIAIAAVAGGATFAYVLSQAPCCDGCAAGQGCGGGATQPYSVDEVSQAAPATAAAQGQDPSDGSDDTTLDGMFE